MNLRDLPDHPHMQPQFLLHLAHRSRLVGFPCIHPSAGEGEVMPAAAMPFDQGDCVLFG